MKFQLSTRYALYAALEMASTEAGRPVTAAQVAERYRIPPSVVAKVIQRLVKAGLAFGTRGTTGGYRLVRPAAEITLLEVVEIFEGGRDAASCSLAGCGEAPCRQFAECRLRRLFEELDEQARVTLASVTLATLVAPRAPLAPLVQLAARRA